MRIWKNWNSYTVLIDMKMVELLWKTVLKASKKSKI
jgi:hypothetical protein